MTSLEANEQAIFGAGLGRLLSRHGYRRLTAPMVKGYEHWEIHGASTFHHVQYVGALTDEAISRVVQNGIAAQDAWAASQGNVACPQVHVWSGLVLDQERYAEIWDELAGAKTYRGLGGRVKIQIHDANAIIDASGQCWSDEASYPLHPSFLAHTDEERHIGERLQQELGDIAPGQANAPRFKKFLLETLNYLFHPPLGRAQIHTPDDSRANIRDIVMLNKMTDDFWRYMQMRYGADYLVAEAKNYKAAVDKKAVLQLCNYLNPFGLGTFGILVTRAGLNTSGRWTVRTQWVSYGKLVIALTDTHILQMLELSKRGGRPSDVIEEVISDFRKSL